jgi:hypothetical protein
VTLVERLEAAHAAAAGHAAPGEEVVGVLPAEPGTGERVYVLAFSAQPGDEELTYLAIDSRHEPIRDRQLVRDAATILALSERAEEASGAMMGDELIERFSNTAQRLSEIGEEAGAAACAAAVDALRELGAAAAGPRVASPGFLDSVAYAAADVGAALGEVQRVAELVAEADPESPAARLLWEGLAAAAQAGQPEDFARAMAATTAAAEAMVDEVCEHYRLPLV